MIFDKVVTTTQAKQNNTYTYTSGSLSAVSGAAMFFGTLDPASGIASSRCNTFVLGPRGEKLLVAYEPRMATADVKYSSTPNTCKCDYLSGDFFTSTNALTAATTILIPHLKGANKKGRSVILQIHLAAGASITFGASSNVISITAGSDYVAGTYCFVFTNIDGSSVQLTNFFRCTGYADSSTN